MHRLLRHRHNDRRMERISPLDMSNLRVEERGMPMHVTALAFLDERELRLDEIRRYVEERIRDVPRLHQVLVRPGRHRTPRWREDHTFDIARHVRTRRLPPPGDEAALLQVCSELNAPPLDRGRPLWELWLLDGLEDGRVALLVRLHHVVADGAAALELFSSLFEPAPSRPVRTSAGGAGRDGWTAGFQASAAAGLMLARRGWALARLGRAPALSWNRPVGGRRVHLLVRGDLARARDTAHAHGGTINDVLLAAVAGGAHRLLESRGELVPGLDLHVSVPASIRRPGESGGNRVGIRVVSVPVSDPDPASRLTTIASLNAAWRDLSPLRPNGRFMQRWAVRLMARQRLINMVVSNMPGPPLPLTFEAAPVREVFQLSLLQGNCAIGVGALSYAGQLNLDVVADADLVPDARVFADGIAEALTRLGAAPASAVFMR